MNTAFRNRMTWVMCAFVYAVSRRLLNRIKQKLSAHARLTSAAVARYSTTVDHVTRSIGRFERHLMAALDTNWLTFPNTLLNLSAASEVDQRSSQYDSSVRILELSSLLEIDEVQVVYSWTQRFWTRSDVRTPFAFQLGLIIVFLTKVCGESPVKNYKTKAYAQGRLHHTKFGANDWAGRYI